MKSTYKLIGVFWDKRPQRDDAIALMDFDPTFLPLDSPLCLFDLIEKKRRIALSHLFAVRHDWQLEELLMKTEGSSLIAIELDCLPQSSGATHQRFFAHRLLQATSALSNQCPSAEVVLMLPENGRSA